MPANDFLVFRTPGIRSAEQDNGARQPAYPQVEHHLQTVDDLVDMIDTKGGKDRLGGNRRIHEDDLAGAIAIDLFHDVGERLFTEDQESALPCGNRLGIDIHGRPQPLTRVGDLLAGSDVQGLSSVFDANDTILTSDAHPGITAANVEARIAGNYPAACRHDGE